MHILTPKNLFSTLLIAFSLLSCTEEIVEVKKETNVYYSNKVNILNYGAKSDGTTDTSDAFVKAFEALKTKGGEIIVPGGRYRLDQAVKVTLNDTISISICGEGILVTELEVRNGEGGFFITMTNEKNKISFSNFNIRTTRKDNGIGISVKGKISENSFRSNFSMRNIELRLFGENNLEEFYFNKNVVVDGVYKPTFSNIVVSAAWGDLTQYLADGKGLGETAFELSNIYAPTFTDCYAWNHLNGYIIRDYKNLGTDPIRITRSYAVGIREGVNIEGAISSPVIIEESHYNCRTYGIQVKNCQNVLLSANMMYYVQKIGAYPGYCDMIVDDCENVNVVSNIYHMPGETERCGVRVKNGGKNILVARNKFTCSGRSILYSSSTQNITTSPNNYDSTVLPPASE